MAESVAWTRKLRGKKTFLVVVIAMVFFVTVLFTISEINGGWVITQTQTTNYYGDVYKHYFHHHFPNASANTKCKVQFKSVLLVIAFNFPYYANIPAIDNLYKKIFPNIEYCGSDPYGNFPIIQLQVNNGYQAYECMGVAIRKHPNFKGYLFLSDDVLLNWWYIKQLDMNKAWISEELLITTNRGANLQQNAAPDRWHWWYMEDTINRCRTAVQEVEKNAQEIFGVQNRGDLSKPSLEVFYNNSVGIQLCTYTRADIFFIPHRMRFVYSNISNIFFKHRVYLEAAFGTIMYYLDVKENFFLLDGLYIAHKTFDINLSDPKVMLDGFNMKKGFLHPFKLSSPLNKLLLEKIFQEMSSMKQEALALDEQNSDQVECQ